MVDLKDLTPAREPEPSPVYSLHRQRYADKNAYEHALLLMGQSRDKAPIRVCLYQNDILDYDALISLEPDDIDELCIRDEAGEVRKLSMGCRAKLKKLVHWADLPGSDVDTFMQCATFSKLHDDIRAHHADLALATTPTIPSVSSSHSSAAENFAKGIKLDPKAYPELDVKTKFQEWKRTFKAVAASHGLSNVIDFNYVANTMDEKDLFESQQLWLYNVFVTILKTRVGQSRSYT